MTTPAQERRLWSLTVAGLLIACLAAVVITAHLVREDYPQVNELRKIVPRGAPSDYDRGYSDGFEAALKEWHNTNVAIAEFFDKRPTPAPTPSPLPAMTQAERDVIFFPTPTPTSTPTKASLFTQTGPTMLTLGTVTASWARWYSPSVTVPFDRVAPDNGLEHDDANKGETRIYAVRNSDSKRFEPSGWREVK